jgi:hypothetical protein
MSRGGKRKGAGRKNQWKSGCSLEETTVIRVPRYLKDEISKLAHRLDAGEEVDLVTKSMKDRNDYLEGKVLELEKKLLNQKKDNKEIVTKSKTEDGQRKLDLDTKSKIVLFGYVLSKKRFGMGKNAVSEAKKRRTAGDFSKWTQSKDPDGIAWIPLDKGYSPQNNLTNEIEAKLKIWIEEHR